MIYLFILRLTRSVRTRIKVIWEFTQHVFLQHSFTIKMIQKLYQKSAYSQLSIWTFLWTTVYKRRPAENDVCKHPICVTNDCFLSSEGTVVECFVCVEFN